MQVLFGLPNPFFLVLQMCLMQIVVFLSVLIFIIREQSPWFDVSCAIFMIFCGVLGGLFG